VLLVEFVDQSVYHTLRCRPRGLDSKISLFISLRQCLNRREIAISRRAARPWKIGAAAEMMKVVAGGIHLKEQAMNEGLIEKITESFQAHGFEGASLSAISKATGLIKASLYWRFPHGKKEMAEAALRSVDQQFSQYVLQPIDEAGPIPTRLAEVANRLREFYGDGKRACLLDTLTLGGSPTAIRKHARITMEYWVSQFEKLARESGLDHRVARLAAEDAVAALEGALVLARVSGDREVFRRAVESLEARLTKPARRN
jgi:TetR/AcrR family transcriptional repressor of lmrAB and yxaGH operons